MIEDGGVYFYPIPSDMLRTYHNKPQVTLVQNGIVSKCEDNCDFEWSIDYTPIVYEIIQSNLKIFLKFNVNLKFFSI